MIFTRACDMANAKQVSLARTSVIELHLRDTWSRGGPRKSDSTISGFPAWYEPCYWQHIQEAIMPRRPRRNHSAALKSKVALAAVKGDKTISECWFASNIDPDFACQNWPCLMRLEVMLLSNFNAVTGAIWNANICYFWFRFRSQCTSRPLASDWRPTGVF